MCMHSAQGLSSLREVVDLENMILLLWSNFWHFSTLFSSIGHSNLSGSCFSLHDVFPIL
jgi:hypothetical protein